MHALAVLITAIEFKIIHFLFNTFLSRRRKRYRTQPCLLFFIICFNFSEDPDDVIGEFGK